MKIVYDLDLGKFELFYCASYQAYLMGLYLIHCGKRIVFITENKDIIRACKELNLEVIKLEQLSQKEIYLNSKNVKECISQLCNLGNGVPLHFTHTQFDAFCFLLVNRYSKMGPVLFYNFEVEYGVAKRFVFEYGFIKKFFQKFLLKMIYGCECVIKAINSIYFIGINNKFIHRNNIKVIDNKSIYYNQIAEAVGDNQIELNKCNSLFLYQDFSNFAVERSINEIHNFISKNDFVVKLHPGRSSVDSILKNMPQFPNYLPSELIFGNVVRSVVAIYSSSLISASKISFLKAISLLELVEWNDDNYKRVLKDDLISNSNGKILFPTTFSELKDLLCCKFHEKRNS